MIFGRFLFALIVGAAVGFAPAKASTIIFDISALDGF